MRKKTEFINECNALMIEAIEGYKDRALQSNKLFEIRQYRNKLSEEIYKKIEAFVNENIRPMVYDMDYWSFIEKDGQYGSYVDNHFVLSSDSSLESIIFRKYHHSCDLLQKLSAFMSEELHLNRD